MREHRTGRLLATGALLIAAGTIGHGPAVSFGRSVPDAGGNGLFATFGASVQVRSTGAKRDEWTQVADKTAFQTLADGSYCRDCVSRERVVVLGSADGPGYLEETGEIDAIVRDRLGNYWVGGQRGAIKVFDSAGSFVREVGQRGQGPMEFQYPMPVHVDHQGRVHVFDSGNRRETIIGPGFELYAERPLPGSIHDAAPLADADRFAVHMLLQTADQIGLPLHIIRGRHVLHSFGAPVEGNSQPLTALTARRVVATGPGGYVFSSSYYEYSIEAWSETGQRITGFTGPQLNAQKPRRGRFTDDNPPPNRIFDLRADGLGRLWVLSWQLKPDWRGQMTERLFPDGRVALVPREGTMAALYHSRIDVIDLDTASIIARTEHDELLFEFLDDGSAVEAHYDEEGNLRLVVWRLSSTL